MRNQKNLLAAAAMAALVSSQAFAANPGDRDTGRPKGQDSGSSKDQDSRGASGPVAGAGLPFLLLAGGYVLFRRYRNSRKPNLDCGDGT
jgi:hypothetical protein